MPGHSGQRWGLDYLLGSSAVVLRESFYLKKKKKNVLTSLIVFEKSRTRFCLTDCISIEFERCLYFSRIVQLLQLELLER